MNYQITGDRAVILRGLRRHYGKSTRQAAWELVRRIAKARKVSPPKVNWDYCLFSAERRRMK